MADLTNLPLSQMRTGEYPAKDPIAELLARQEGMLDPRTMELLRSIENRRGGGLPGTDLPRPGFTVPHNQLMMDLGYFDIPGPVGTRP